MHRRAGCDHQATRPARFAPSFRTCFASDRGALLTCAGADLLRSVTEATSLSGSRRDRLSWWLRTDPLSPPSESHGRSPYSPRDAHDRRRWRRDRGGCLVSGRLAPTFVDHPPSRRWSRDRATDPAAKDARVEPPGPAEPRPGVTPSDAFQLLALDHRARGDHRSTGTLRQGHHVTGGRCGHADSRLRRGHHPPRRHAVYPQAPQ